MTEERRRRGDRCVAANWKMHKTNAEARAFIAQLPAGARRATDVDVGRVPALHGARARWSRPRATRLGVAAQNMHEEHAGRVHRRGVGADADRAGRPRRGAGALRAAPATSARPMPRWPRKVPAALAAGLTPILCVGETEAERDAGEMERKLRQQVQTDLAAVAAESLPAVVIAYEPIWAIGTGRTATPEQAQEAIAFVRALIGDRDHATRRSACGSSTAAASTRPTRPSCSASPTWTAHSSAERASTRTSSPRSWRPRRRQGHERRAPAPARVGARGAGRLGPRAARSRERRSRWPHTPVFDALWETLPAHRS